MLRRTLELAYLGGPEPDEKLGAVKHTIVQLADLWCLRQLWGCTPSLEDPDRAAEHPLHIKKAFSILHQYEGSTTQPTGW
jgi:hypothetical protein